MFPLPLRNALAHLAIDGLDHDDARAALVWLARRDDVPRGAAAERLAREHLIDPGASAVLDVHAPHDGGIRAHAAHALAAAEAYRRLPGDAADAVAAAIARAAALWDARLFFEVHEVLEAVWQRAGGETRHALQGLIQIAVAFYHLAAGNLRGARQLLRDGRERLAAAGSALPVVDAAALLELTAPWAEAFAESRPLPGSAPPRFPRLSAGPPA